MPSPPPTTRLELLQGTLDMLVLRSLLFGPLHGHAIATHIQRTSDDMLRVDHGSLYPALYRLKKRGWITASWEPMPDRNREAKYYRLTAAGKKRLASEHSKWRQLARAIGLVMEPVR
jgi:transcriptional regulator